MSDETNNGDAAEPAEPAKTWQPSLKPAHRLDSGAAPRGSVIEDSGRGGALGALRAWIARPLVKAGLVIAALILGAIVFDATLNQGDWTIRKEKAEAGEHRGVPKMPR